MRQEYNKLVRDRIPEIVREKGCDCEIAILTEEAYRRALMEKLIEEAREAAEAAPDDLVTELADLLEVFDAILTSHRIGREMVSAEQEKRRKERGGFDERIKLLWVEE